MNRETLENKTNAELRQLCKDNGIVGMSKKPKNVLIDALLQNESEESNSCINISKSSKNNLITTEVTIDLKNSKVGSIKVYCGACSGNFPVVGKTILQARTIVQDGLNVSVEANPLVNGDVANENYVLKEKDILEFVRPSGRKG